MTKLDSVVFYLKVEFNYMMTVSKQILYIFSIEKDNNSSFTKTMVAAEKLNAQVVCFTSVKEEGELDLAYQHLLELFGVFQTKINKWQEIKTPIKKVLKVGNFVTELSDVLKAFKFETIVCTTKKAGLNKLTLEEIIGKHNKNSLLIMN